MSKKHVVFFRFLIYCADSVRSAMSVVHAQMGHYRVGSWVFAGEHDELRKRERDMLALRIGATTALLLFAGAASAQSVLGNLPGTPAPPGSNLGLGADLFDRTKGVGLTVGTDNLNFISMVALMSNPDTADLTLSGGIYSSSGGNPGSLLAMFDSTTVAAGSTGVLSTLTIGGGFTMLAGQSYWFVLDGPSFINGLLWNSLDPNTAPTASGVIFEGYRFSSDGGVNWGTSSIFNGFTINAAVPAPGALALFGVAGLAGVRRRR